MTGTRAVHIQLPLVRNSLLLTGVPMVAEGNTLAPHPLISHIHPPFPPFSRQTVSSLPVLSAALQKYLPPTCTGLLKLPLEHTDWADTRLLPAVKRGKNWVMHLKQPHWRYADTRVKLVKKQLRNTHVKGCRTGGQRIMHIVWCVTYRLHATEGTGLCQP